jgi:hypothetical protein
MTRFFLKNDDRSDKVAERLEAVKSKMPANIREAHEHCARHRQEVVASELCGCFYCLNTFEPKDIADWADDGKTAFCPRCGIDSVIGSASGFAPTKDFLKEMNDYWFGESPSR